MPKNNIIFILGIAFFGVVILLGESFKLNLGLGKISLCLIVLGSILATVINKTFRFYAGPLEKLVYIFGGIFIIYTVIGFFSGNPLPDVFEDLYPCIVFVAMFIVFRTLNIAEIDRLWKVIILFGVLATVKVLIIAVMPFDIAWDNNWQAAKESLPLAGYSRVILRGGDIFLSFSFVYYMINVQRKIRSNLFRNLIFILLTCVAVFISLSRSSFFADGVALTIIFFLFRNYFSTRRLVTLSSILIVILIALLPFIDAISLAASIFESRKDAFDADDISVEFRLNERSIILDKASSVYYMGNGLGSYFYMSYSGSEKEDGRSIYAHDYNTWLIFKTGITGLIVFYLIFFKSCYNFFWCLRQKNELNSNYHLLILSVLACGIVLLVISFLANKLSTLSGGLFFAFFAASSAIIKRKYESSI